MYSNSQSYLGGTNGPRPGQPPYGQQPFGQPQYGMQTPNSFQQQPTGFGVPGGVQPQATGYPQQLPYQNTGFPVQNTQQAQQPRPQMPSSQQALPTQRMQPQQTGRTSAQMADSFRMPPAQAMPQAAPPSVSGPRIPNMRLSFITAKDQANFEQLFKSAAANSQSVSGDQARDILLRSKLPGDTLSKIWYDFPAWLR